MKTREILIRKQQHNNILNFRIYNLLSTFKKRPNASKGSEMKSYNQHQLSLSLLLEAIIPRTFLGATLGLFQD